VCRIDTTIVRPNKYGFVSISILCVVRVSVVFGMESLLCRLRGGGVLP